MRGLLAAWPRPVTTCHLPTPRTASALPARYPRAPFLPRTSASHPRRTLSNNGTLLLLGSDILLDSYQLILQRTTAATQIAPTTTPLPNTRMTTTGTTRLRVRNSRTGAVVRGSLKSHSDDTSSCDDQVIECNHRRGVCASLHVAGQYPRWQLGRGAGIKQAG